MSREMRRSEEAVRRSIRPILLATGPGRADTRTVKELLSGVGLSEKETLIHLLDIADTPENAKRFYNRYIQEEGDVGGLDPKGWKVRIKVDRWVREALARLLKGCREETTAGVVYRCDLYRVIVVEFRITAPLLALAQAADLLPVPGKSKAELLRELIEAWETQIESAGTRLLAPYFLELPEQKVQSIDGDMIAWVKAILRIRRKALVVLMLGELRQKEEFSDLFLGAIEDPAANDGDLLSGTWLLALWAEEFKVYKAGLRRIGRHPFRAASGLLKALVGTLPIWILAVLGFVFLREFIWEHVGPWAPHVLLFALFVAGAAMIYFVSRR